MKQITAKDVAQLKVDLVEVRPDAQMLIETIVQQTYDSLPDAKGEDGLKAIDFNTSGEVTNVKAIIHGKEYHLCECAKGEAVAFARQEDIDMVTYAPKLPFRYSVNNMEYAEFNIPLYTTTPPNHAQDKGEAVAWRYRYTLEGDWMVSTQPTCESHLEWLKETYKEFEIHPLFTTPPNHTEALLLAKEALQSAINNFTDSVSSNDEGDSELFLWGTLATLKQALAEINRIGG